MKTISLKLPDELHALLEDLSRRRNVPKSEVVRAALAAYLDGKSRMGRPSCAALAGDLVGSLDGPANLATGAQHLAGYGR